MSEGTKMQTIDAIPYGEDRTNKSKTKQRNDGHMKAFCVYQSTKKSTRRDLQTRIINMIHSPNNHWKRRRERHLL